MIIVIISNTSHNMLRLSEKLLITSVSVFVFLLKFNLIHIGNMKGKRELNSEHRRPEFVTPTEVYFAIFTSLI